MRIIGVCRSPGRAEFILIISLLLLCGCDESNGGRGNNDAAPSAVSGGVDGSNLASDGIEVTGFYFQYRNYTYGDGDRHEYRGLVGLSKRDAPIQESDIAGILMKDKHGNEIKIKEISYYRKNFIQGSWDLNTCTAIFSDKTDSGYMIKYDPDAKIAKGVYTYQINTTGNEVLSIHFYFPGNDELPAPQLASMQHEKRPNGNVLFSWNNPEGSYDEIKFSLHATTAQHGSVYDLFEIVLPRDKDELIIPKEVIDKMTRIHSPLSFIWQIKTHANTATGMNYARGWSDFASLCWLDCTPPQVLKQSCVPPHGSTYNANISHKIELRFNEKMNGIYSYDHNIGKTANQWSPDTTTLMITFSENLIPGREYFFRLNPGDQTGGFSDIAGNSLEHNTLFRFIQE